MKFGPVLTVSLLICIVVSSVASAQVVDIPDSNLRTAIAGALNIAHDAPIARSAMRRLTKLYADRKGIVNLTGLEHAINLRTLVLFLNPLADLTPIANLQNLEYLDISGCSITDITPLSNLVSLNHLNAEYNSIVDVTPLANLMRLESLIILHNQIADHGPLDNLTLSRFEYDQTCEMPPLPLEPRLANRNYPSIFSPWAGLGYFPISNRPESSDIENLARHDLWWDTNAFELRFIKAQNRFKIAGEIDKAIRQRDDLLALSPNMVVLVQVRMRNAPLDHFPEDWPHWIRDEQGAIFLYDSGVRLHGLIDFTHPAVQDMIVQQAIAVSGCGLYDGIFFDYWSESWPVLSGWDGTQRRHFRTLEEEQRARDAILRRIRAETRRNFLIIGNTNDRIIPRTGPYINGGFMETILPYSRPSEDLDSSLTRVEASLKWLDANLRKPTMNALEGTIVPTEPPDSPTNRRWMRTVTTLSLTHSNDYVLFKSGGGHPHYWYDFWDADLGQPVSAKAQLYNEEIPGLYIREFTNGWAVYNHNGETQVITLPELATGVASGVESMTHTLPNIDGEMYLRVKPKNPADVNGDGAVNILDLTLVAQALGTDGLEADANGVVNVFDLVFVAGEMQ